MSHRTKIDRLLGSRGPMTEPDAGEVARVAHWRALRMSWTQIARNLGRAEPDVRKTHDPDWRGHG